jgi:branched-chain amino acid aminotransferase
MTLHSKTIWMDGVFVDFEKATLHFLTPGLHYGIGVFEGIRCYKTAHGPAVFRLKEHITRFLYSAACLGFRELPFSEQDLVDACTEVVVRNEFEDCYIRPLLTLATGGWNLNLDGGSPVDQLPRGRGPGARRARERVVLHSPPPQRHHDEGQDLRQLCQ